MEKNGNYLAVKKLLALLRGITSKYYSDFYCLIYLRSFRTNTNLNCIKRYVKIKIMISEDNKILEFNQYQKSDKALFLIHADLECITEKIDGYKNDPEKSFITKVTEYIPSVFSMSTISSLRSIENKHDVYRTKDCMNKFCEFLRERAMKITNFKKKKMKLLTK